MTTKHGNVVTHHKGLPPKHSYNSLNMCSRDVTLQTENIVSYYHNDYGHKT